MLNCLKRVVSNSSLSSCSNLYRFVTNLHKAASVASYEQLFSLTCPQTLALAGTGRVWFVLSTTCQPMDEDFLKLILQNRLFIPVGIKIWGRSGAEIQLYGRLVVRERPITTDWFIWPIKGESTNHNRLGHLTNQSRVDNHNRLGHLTNQSRVN